MTKLLEQLELFPPQDVLTDQVWGKIVGQDFFVRMEKPVGYIYLPLPDCVAVYKLQRVQSI